MFFEAIKMAFSSLIHNKMRTFLTVLGVVIGITAIISLMTLVQGATDATKSQLVSAGANKLSVNVVPTSIKSGLNDRDIETLERIDNVEYITGSSSRGYSVTVNDRSEDAIVISTDENTFFGNDDVLTSGRYLLPLDINNETNVCVIASHLSQKLFGKMSPIGYTLKISGIDFIIVGELDSSNSNIGESDNIFLPKSTAKAVLNFNDYTRVSVSLIDTTISQQTQKAIEDELYKIYNENDNFYSVLDMQALLDMFGSIMGTMSGLLTGIAAISLLVGGVGIMNMMLTSVAERTNEIGLRKALGAKPTSIMMQFLLEAVFISLFGGLIGVAFGVGLAQILGIAFKITPTITIGILSLAFGFSAAVGLLFGILPARRAANLNPIDALRSN